MFTKTSCPPPAPFTVNVENNFPTIFLINLVSIAVFQYQLCEYAGRNARRIISGTHGVSVVGGVREKNTPSTWKMSHYNFFSLWPIRLCSVRLRSHGNSGKIGNSGYPLQCLHQHLMGSSNHLVQLVPSQLAHLSSEICWTICPCDELTNNL